MRITTSTPEKVTITASSGRQRITFEGNSEVRIFEDTGNAIGMRRSGDDLVIQMRNGETVQIVDYYNAPSDIEVYFVDDAGQIWVMENILGTEQFVFTRADDDDGAAAFADMGLLGLAGLLGLGAAAAGMGGGGDGEGEDGDTTPPAAPGLELAEDTGESDSDGITNNNVVNVTGVEAGASWEYSYDGGEIWHQGSGDSFTLPDGDYEDGDILVHQTDQAGNQSEDGTLGGVSVDTEAPDAPSIGEVVDDAGDDTGALSSGDLTDDATPTVSGTGTPGDTITLYDGDTEIGSAEVDADGNWEITPSTPLDDGGHILSVSATDPAGNEGDRSDIFLLTVDATAPDAPSLDDITVYDDEPEITGDLDSGDVTDDVQPTISGAGGTEGDTVTLYVGTDVVATTVVGADGSWAFSPDPTFSDGDTVEMTFTYTDEAGNESAPSDPFTLTFDSTAPDAPDAGDITVTDDVAPLTGELADGDETDDTKPTFSGINGTPGETVTVYSGSTAIGTAVVGEDGTWSLDPETELDEGAHDFTVTYTDEAGNESAPTDPMSLTVDTTSPDFPSSSTLIVLDNVGDTQGQLSSGDLTDDDALTVSGTGGTEGETVTLYVDGVAVATTLVGAGGTWSFADDVELEDGDHVLAYTFSDAAGNESDPSPDFELTVDTVAPDAPDASEITVTDDVDPITGTLEDGDDTNDTLPTFAGAAGSATAGDTVTVYANGESIGTAEVAADGSWSLEPTNDLDDGEYSFTVTYTDEAGNESAPTEILSATVDTGVPTIDRATIDSAYDDVGGTTGDLSSGDTTDDTKPEFTGSVSVTGETLTGLIVTLYADDGNGPVAVGSVVLSDETGDWTITPDEPLDNDDYTFSITVSDAAGNESTPAGSFALTINGTVPDAPTIDTLSDNVGTVTGDIAPNGVTDDTQPTISGSGAAEGDTVSIFVDGVEVGSTTADVGGNWSLELETPLEAGTHTVTATTTTAAGNESPSSNAVTFTIATEAPAAADNTETIALDVTPSATEVAQADLPSETGFFVANVGLGAVLDLGLIDIEDQIQIDVAEGTVQQLTLTSNAGGVSILTDFDLYIYKYNEDLEQWDLYQSEASWLEVYLLGGVSDELTVTLPEGQYAFILSGDSGVSLLTGYTLNVESQVIFDYNDPQVVQGTVSGNVITDVEEEASAGRDEVPTGTVVTDVDGTAVVDGAPSVIEGSFGTLTIYADGSYTYDVNEDFAGPYGSVDTFTYTVTAPNGTTDSAHLSITLELGAADEVVDVDATVVLGFTPTVSTLPEDQLQSSTDVGVLQLATSTGDENAILSATALNEVGGLSVEVAENTVQEITLDANAGGITIYGEYFLAIYKLDEETGNYALYDSDYWFTLYLLGAAADEITVSLPEGSYQLVIASGEAVSLLGGNSIWMTEAVVYDYNDPVEGAGSVIGSVTGDVAEGADTMYRVGEDLFSGDPMVVEGTYGTLEINADGTYTYTVTVSDEAGWTPPFGEIETFTYTTVDSEGNYSVGTLNIEIDMVGANDDTAEVDMDLTNVVTTETVSLYTSTFGGALSTETTDEGSFTVENDADTVTTVDVSFSSEQVGANGTVSWTLYDVNDNVVDSGVFTMTDGTNLSEQLSFDGLTSGTYTFAIDLDESATFGYNEANVEITVTSTELTETELVEVDTVSGNILLNDGATAPSSVVSIEIGGETLAAGSYAGDTSITVVGTHGTLTLGSDGGYTYEPTGDSFGVETFDYTITTAAGTESTAVLTIDVGANITGSAFGDTFASTAGADSFETGAGADTITYDAMNEGGPDVWIDFNQGEGDVLDLSALLSGVTTDNVDNYLEVTNVDGNTVVSVDTAGGAEFTELVVLEGSELLLQDLLENGLAGVSQL